MLCDMMRCLVRCMRLWGYPLLAKRDSIFCMPRILHSMFDPSLLARSICEKRTECFVCVGCADS